MKKLSLALPTKDNGKADGAAEDAKKEGEGNSILLMKTEEDRKKFYESMPGLMKFKEELTKELKEVLDKDTVQKDQFDKVKDKFFSKMAEYWGKNHLVMAKGPVDDPVEEWKIGCHFIWDTTCETYPDMCGGELKDPHHTHDHLLSKNKKGHHLQGEHHHR